VNFVLTFGQGEIFKQTKERLSKRTGIKGKPFEKIKFSVVPRNSFPNAKYIEDGKSIRSNQLEPSGADELSFTI
jgi:ubiquitin carboxyl-terminal hydrolase 7